jgi:hypothetical protein
MFWSHWTDHRQVSDIVLGFNTSLTKHKPVFNKLWQTSQILPQLVEGVTPHKGKKRPKHVAIFIKLGAININKRAIFGGLR